MLNEFARLSHGKEPNMDSFELSPRWEWIERGGPVLATAIHNGHLVRDELKPYLHASDEVLRRDEDPMTGVWASVGDDVFRTMTSRFEVDLNRSRERAFSSDPKETWGVRMYRQRPPDELVERVLEEHDRFYAFARKWIEASIRKHRKIILLDFHSYNHRRNVEEKPEPQAGNPDVDLGMSTMDSARFGAIGEQLIECLQARQVDGRALDVRVNVRYPDGGHFPEWVFAEYGQDVCTITLEVKKFYMDETTGQVSLRAVDDLLRACFDAKAAMAEELRRCG